MLFSHICTCWQLSLFEPMAIQTSPSHGNRDLAGGTIHGQPTAGLLFFLSSIPRSEFLLRQAGPPNYQKKKKKSSQLNTYMGATQHTGIKNPFCFLLGMWVANKPKGIKIETWQARPPSTGKNNIYLINSVPKQQPT